MRIAITPGEPAGIGPDLLIQYLQQQGQHELVCIADATMLQQRAERLGLPLTIKPYPQPQSQQATKACLQVIDTPLVNEAVCGQLDKENASAVLNALQRAVEGCLQGEFDALVTGPMHKGIINEAGIAFTGHTEFLAEKSHTDKVVMMLAAPESATQLRVALATTHLPLARVSESITQDELKQVIRILHREMQTYFTPQPRILVCGLNPHAGEDGHLGREEIETIIPLINRLQHEGMQISGPYPADTVFTQPYLEQADVILAMYHDQGLPVLKHLGFGNAVNVTLGLPFIRTSVDHGTALDLAGSGKASTGSLHAAISLATEMAKKQKGLQHGA